MIRERFEGPVKVILNDEEALGGHATITVDEGGAKFSLNVHAVIEHKRSADGGLYPCVVFKKVESV